MTLSAPNPANKEEGPPPSPIKRVLKLLASTDIFLVACAWLIVLVVVGTLVQAEIGLYLAQKRYFSSFLTRIGGVPLPGGGMTLGIIAINLLFKIIFFSPLEKRRVGTLVTHIGALILIVGGFLTARFSFEGYMVLVENQFSNFISSYQNRELAVIDTSGKDFEQVTAFGGNLLQEGSILANATTVPFKIEVLRYYENVSWQRRPQAAGEEYHGFAKMFLLSPLKPFKEYEQNSAGIELRITGLGENLDGIYYLFEGMEIPQTIEVQDKKFRLDLRRERRYLPFSLHLVDFKKEFYPGTETPSHFSSTVILRENTRERRAVIRMNEPLRHRGYTFYQSSYFDTEDRKEASVLAVVHNIGRNFPYISSIIMCIGVLIHLFLLLPNLLQRVTQR